MSAASLSLLFAKLDILVLERLAEGSFRILSDIPAWLPDLYPGLQFGQGDYNLGEDSQFLQSFLGVAEDHWSRNQEGQLLSGPWTERGTTGREYRLQATALCLGSAKILLWELLGEDFEEKKALLQKAREIKFAYEQLTKEFRDKNTLIHCIAFDLSEPLVGIENFLSLLNASRLTAKEKQSFEISKRQLRKLEKLIQELMQVSSPNQDETGN